MSLVSRAIRTLAPLGGYQLAKRICRNRPRILMYHRFSESPAKGWSCSAIFERQVQYIRDNYNSYSLAEIIQFRREHGRWPKDAIVITVDDGYRDFYQYAYPILMKYKMPATLFVTTGFVEGDTWLWPDKITWLLNQVDQFPDSFSFCDFQVEAGPLNAESRPIYWQKLVDYALSLPDADKHLFIYHLAGFLENDIPYSIPSEFAPVSWDELAEVQRHGIEVGGHTISHPSLGRVDEQQAEREIFGCFSKLREKLGDRPRTFCYPNGQPEDFQAFLPKIVERSGFLGAVTAFPDARGIEETYLMRRHAGGDDMFQFYKSVSGVELLGAQLRKQVRLATVSGTDASYA